MLFKSVKYALRWMPDMAYIQLYFFASFKKFCNLKNPQTYNEKLNWLKLNDHNPIYTKLVDKYEVKEYVAKLIGEKYIIPTLGLYNSFDEIDFDKLPESFVIKCTHDSAGVIIVKDKSSLNFDIVKRKIEESLNYNFYYIAREWPYKNVKPRIIIEQYMQDSKSEELEDFKFYCFDGKVACILVCKGRSHGVKYYYFNPNWEFLRWDKETSKEPEGYSLVRPRNFDKMLEIAKTLSKGFTHVRVDLYDINGIIYFGELTFFTNGGFDTDITPECDRILGRMMRLPQNNGKA